MLNLPSRARIAAILGIGLPIVGGMISQNILNIIDTAMVGTLGDAALAAAGIGSFFTFMAQSMILGLSAGVQAISSRRWGADRQHESAYSLNAGIIFAIIGGSLLTVVLFWVSPYLFSLLVSDSHVEELGIGYVQARLLGIVAVGINFSFRGFWNGISQSRVYLQALLLVHFVNIVCNYLLIFGKFGFPELGVTGSAIGTTIALSAGTIYYLVHGFLRARQYGFLKKLPSLSEMGPLLSISFYSGIQTLFFSAGLMMLYWIIGRIGTSELAAANVLINLTLICVLPGIALGLAAGSLTGQALGQNDIEAASAWGWDVAKVAAFCLTILSLPMIFCPDVLLSGFLHDPATRLIAILPLRLIGLSMGLEAVGLVLLNAQLTSGASKQIMTVSIFLQWGLFLPMAYLWGPQLGYGLVGIWICQVFYRTALAFSMALLWKRRAWASVKV